MEAVTQMRGCLQSLGRPLPTTKLDLISSLFWSMIRQVVHRVGLCRLVEWKAASLWRAHSEHDVKLSARDAAVIYHKLLQLHLTGIISCSSSSSSSSRGGGGGSSSVVVVLLVVVVVVVIVVVVW